MSYQPPTGTHASDSYPTAVAPTPSGTPAVPVAPSPVPSDLLAPSGQPYASGRSVPSGLTSTGQVVSVRPWRSSNAAIAVAAQVLVGLIGLANLVVAFVDVRLGELVDDRDLDALVDTAGTAESISRIVTLLALAAVAFFLVWVHRIWTSDRSAHHVYTRGTGLAVGGWLIPVVNFVLGPLALRDLWHGTEYASRGIVDGPVDRRTPRLVAGWWVAWCLMLVTTLAGRGLQAGVEGATSLDELVSALKSALEVEILACVVSAVAATLLILVIRRIMSFTRR